MRVVNPLLLIFTIVFLLIQFSSKLYNGEFNKYHAILKSNINIEILDSWKHNDTTLEDFGFFIKFGECILRVDFYEAEKEKWNAILKPIDVLKIKESKYPASTKVDNLAIINTTQFFKTDKVSIHEILTNFQMVNDYIFENTSNIKYKSTKENESSFNHNEFTIYYDPSNPKDCKKRITGQST